MRPEDAALRGVYYRLRDDATLATLMGGVGPRVFLGKPTDTLTEADTPRLTCWMVADPARRLDIEEVLVQVDEFVWGKAENLAADIDERVLGLMGDSHDNVAVWSWGGFRFHSYVTSGLFVPGGAGQLGQRTRRFLVGHLNGGA